MDGSAVAQGDPQVIDSRAIGIDLERWSRADIQSKITDQCNISIVDAEFFLGVKIFSRQGDIFSNPKEFRMIVSKSFLKNSS